MKGFMPPMPATRSRTHAATHEPSTVTIAPPRLVAKYSPGSTFTASAGRLVSIPMGFLLEKVVDGLAARAQEVPGEVMEVLGVAREEDPAAAHQRTEALQDLELRGLGEVDHRVPAEDRRERPLDGPAVVAQVHVAEFHHGAHV